jgi:hypothetical protein
VWIQSVDLNRGAQDKAGWCLRFAQRVFNISTTHKSAWIACGATTSFHADDAFPPIAVPVWFSHFGDYDGEGVKQWGHVAAWLPGEGFLSSPAAGYGQTLFPTLDAISAALNVTLIGWSEDIDGHPIAIWQPEHNETELENNMATGAFYRIQDGDTNGGQIYWQERPNSAFTPLDYPTWLAFASNGNKFANLSAAVVTTLIAQHGLAADS